MNVSIELDDIGVGDGDLIWSQATVIITGEISYHEGWDHNCRTTGYSSPQVENITVIGHPGYLCDDDGAAFEKFIKNEYEFNAKFKEKVNSLLLEQCPQYLNRKIAI